MKCSRLRLMIRTRRGLLATIILAPPILFLAALLASAAVVDAAADGADRGAVSVRNNLCAIGFAPHTGVLMGITNVPLADQVLKGKSSPGTPFRIHADFAHEWLLDTDAEKAARVHLGPEGLTLRSARNRPTREGEDLELTYTGEGFECVLQVSLAADSGESTWTLSVKNAGQTPRAMLVEFPRLDGLQLGASGSPNRQTALDRSGLIVNGWTSGGGIYGNGPQWSMQWHAIFDPSLRSALGFIVMDPQVRNKRLVVAKPCVAVQYFPPQTLAPGEAVTLPPVRLLVYQGDWKRTARAYAAWYAKAFQHATPPQWFQQSDAFDGRHMKKKTPGARRDYPSQFMLDSFRELPAAVVRTPFDHLEYGFWCRGSMLHPGTSVHADGDYVVREDLGGAQAMHEGFAEVRKLGLHSTLYIEGYIVHKESDLAKTGKAQRWALMHRNGSIDGSYTGYGFYHMCPGCVEWQDHLVSVVSRVLKETGADGIRLDSLGFYFQSCYNAAHHHRSPFDYNDWIKQLLSKVRDAALAVNPNALLTTEAPVDFYGQWFHSAIADPSPRDLRYPPPMRLAVGSYRPFLYHTPGPLFGSLSGFIGGLVVGKADFQVSEANWLCARVPVHDTLVWGDVADEDPGTTDPEVVTRRFTSQRCEAIVAARAVAGPGPSFLQLSDRRARYEVLIPAGPFPPKTVATCDIETLHWQSCTPSVREGNLAIATESNWLLVVVPRADGRVVSFDPLPDVRPGGDAVIRPETIAGDRSSDEVEVWAPGLQVGPTAGCRAQVRVGSQVTIRVPDDAPPGWYQIRVRGQNILGVKRFLHVVGNDATSK